MEQIETKVKMFESSGLIDLEEQINDFIWKVNLIDIKTITTTLPSFITMVIYKERED